MCWNLPPRVAEKGILNTVGEVGSAANLILAAVHSAALDVRINAAAVKEGDVAQQWLRDSAALEDKAGTMAETIRHIMHNRLIPDAQSGQS